jgi:hypothetical protein
MTKTTKTTAIKNIGWTATNATMATKAMNPTKATLIIVRVDMHLGYHSEYY